MSADIPLKFRIWSTALYSPVELSHALSLLNVSHSVSVNRLRKDKIVNLHHSQPRWVRIINDIDGAKSEDHNLICGAMSKLALTNIPKFPDLDLGSALRFVLTSERMTRVEVKKSEYMDYVNLIAKPSVLNIIQTKLYKIQPYDLRKKTQKIIIEFFNSKISEQQAIRFLNRSYKTDSIVELLAKGNELRAAVLKLKSGSETAESISTRTGIPTFELLYLNRN